MMVQPPTPEEFKNTMLEIKNKNTFNDNTIDLEECHINMDSYILETLNTLGYGEGVNIFRTTPKWYS